ncbi:heparinase II/III family protein [Erythrobacter alti]|uniref:heparinase II/III family protein n=1 Tax=Erythrobacter alti TaxID=1896145 RepID=UPI0030F3DA2E
MNAQVPGLRSRERAAENTVPRQMAIPLDMPGEELLVEDERREIETPELPPALEISDAPDAPDTHETIAADRALVLTDFDPPAISAAERFVRMAYRLGVPGSTLASPFRKPARTRLLATVESTLQGERAAGMALRAGHFFVHGVKSPIAQVDFGPTAKATPPLERVVHGFTWLRDLDACAPRPQCTAVAERILASWLKANPRPGKGPAWKIEHAGLRLLGWLVHAPLILSAQDKGFRQDMLATIEETARWLDRNVTRAPERMEEIAGWCAITAAGLLLSDGKPRRLFGEAGLARALGELVGDDGGVLSRSPVAQMQAIELLVELSACYRAAKRGIPDAIGAVLSLLVPPLLALTHGDGGLGSWQGGAAVPADRLAALIEASGVRARPLREPRGWGYQRLSAKPAVLQVDASPPPLGRHARTGCASTLAFEFSHGDHRLIVNCGGAALAGGQVPIRIEQGLRATAAHSTLVLGDANSTAVLLNGKLGGGVGEVEIDLRTVDLGNGSARRLEATHDGYGQRFGLLHKRILILRDDGSELRGEDVLVPSGRKGKRGKVPFAIRFHLGRHVEATLSDNKRGASLLLPDGSLWQFVTGASEIEIEESMWVDGNGRPHPVQQLVIQGLASRGGGNFSWLLKRMG